MRDQRKRLQRVKGALDTLPVRADVSRRAYQHFHATGELPLEQRVAAAVVRSCKNGVPDDEWNRMTINEHVQHMMKSLRPDDPIMNALRNEATWGGEVVRQAARDALVFMHDLGLDVTEPVFNAAGPGPPDWGSVGLWVLGFPECLEVPPYEQQAKRLFERFVALRKRTEKGNPRFVDTVVAAMRSFRTFGELPDDELLREWVLANGELSALMRYYMGAGDAELMAAFDAVAMAEGDERGVALARVQVLAAEGRLAQAPDDG